MSSPGPEASPYGESPYPSSGPAHLGYAATGGFGYGPAVALAPVPSYEQIAAGRVELPIGEVLGEAWSVTRQNLGMLVLGFVVMGLVIIPAFLGLAVISLFPFIGPLVQSVISLVLTGPFIAGFTVVALRACGGRDVQLGHFFGGFKKFGPLAVAYIVPSLLTSVPGIVVMVPLAIGVAAMGEDGLWLLGIGIPLICLPVFYLSMAFMWTQWLVLDRNERFWSAMMGSMKIVNRCFFSLLLLCITLFLINFTVLATTGLGLLLTLPFSLMAMGVAFRRIFGLAGGAEHLG